jgi:hypothetical protein
VVAEGRPRPASWAPTPRSGRSPFPSPGTPGTSSADRWPRLPPGAPGRPRWYTHRAAPTSPRISRLSTKASRTLSKPRATSPSTRTGSDVPSMARPHIHQRSDGEGTRRNPSSWGISGGSRRGTGPGRARRAAHLAERGWRPGPVRPHETGSAAGLLNAVQQLGGTRGIALLGSVFLHVFAEPGGSAAGAAALQAAALRGTADTFCVAVGLLATTAATVAVIGAMGSHGRTRRSVGPRWRGPGGASPLESAR